VLLFPVSHVSAAGPDVNPSGLWSLIFDLKTSSIDIPNGVSEGRYTISCTCFSFSSCLGSKVMIMPESQEKWESKDEAKSGTDLALFWSSIGDTPRQRNVTPSSSLHMTDKSFNADLRRRCWWSRAPSRNSEWNLMESREKIRTCPLIARLMQVN
jgi:hypothetical protein